MSPALNGSSEIRGFERRNAIEIRDGITFDFYTGLPQVSFKFAENATISLKSNMAAISISFGTFRIVKTLRDYDISDYDM